jgi:hypothetical protein
MHARRRRGLGAVKPAPAERYFAPPVASCCCRPDTLTLP